MAQQLYDLFSSRLFRFPCSFNSISRRVISYQSRFLTFLDWLFRRASCLIHPPKYRCGKRLIYVSLQYKPASRACAPCQSIAYIDHSGCSSLWRFSGALPRGERCFHLPQTCNTYRAAYISETDVGRSEPV